MERRILHSVSFLIVTLLTGLSHGARAGTLDDYKEAYKNLKDGRRPCETIPYSDLRRECVEKSTVVNNDCKVVQWSCEGEMREFHDIKGSLSDRKAKQTKIEDLKKENDKFNDAIRSSKDDKEIEDLKKRIEANERQIYDLKKGVEEAEKEIGVRKEKIEKRIEWAKRCIESREAVMKIFESAISKAKGETGDDIRVMRDELIAVWEPSVKDHNQPVSDIKSGIRKCEEMRDQRK